MRLVNRVLAFLLAGLRPMLGPPARCRFTVSCTEFALLQLRERSLGRALWAIIKRLLSCHPFAR